MTMWKKAMMILAVSVFVMGISGCKEKGTAEKAGEKIDETMEKAADKMEEAGEAAKDMVDK